MQPYFFPYLGYFDLINYTTDWIIFDTPQYIKGGWINRNRILHTNKQTWSYITIPVKKYTFSIPIREIVTDNNANWQRKILAQTIHYKKFAPYYDEVKNLLSQCLKIQEQSISRLNAESIKLVCEYLDINFSFHFFSEMKQSQYITAEHAGDWAFKISQDLGAIEYVNPLGGETLFDYSQFAQANIKLTIRKLPTFEYQCEPYQFHPNLSIIDVLMWNAPQEVKAYLDSHK